MSRLKGDRIMSVLDDLRLAEVRISDAQTYLRSGMLEDAVYEVEQAFELIENVINVLDYVRTKKGLG